ncbi:hypothetical protein [Chitinophaga sp.]|uniref:hypothetical protein n=1 Tax=Chitinophaga sp. TaxID=1869181 RepID=UPI0031D59F7C
MKNYKKTLSVIASVAIAGAAIGAILTRTEKGKQLLAEMKKKKHCNSHESVESILK